MFKFSDRSLSRMEGVDPEIILTFKKSLEISPIDFGIPGDGGVRTAERQNKMFVNPSIKTKCDGFDRKSHHQIWPGNKYGEALDFYAYIQGHASWDKRLLAMVAAVILSTNKRLIMDGVIKTRVRWGGTFGSLNYNGWDFEHIVKIA